MGFQFKLSQRIVYSNQFVALKLIEIFLFHSSYTLAETYGEEGQSILNTAKLWTQNVSVFIGPQETCNHEARMAASFNLPMISHLCSDARTSDKVKVLHLVGLL